MFSPDADVLPYNINNNTEAPKKVISHANTRLSEQNDEIFESGRSTQPPSPTRSRVEAAITGTPCK